MKRPALLILSLTLLLAAMAQEQQRVVTSSYMLELGSAYLADTYLTPLHYEGTHSGLLYDRRQPMRFSPEKWEMQLNIGATADYTHSPSGNAIMLDAAVEVRWGMMRRFDLPKGFSVAVGGSTGINVGALYLGRNGNNPASAKADWTVNLTGTASWRGRVWRVPVAVSYQPTLPCVGAFFSPEYGQLYYQIYMGDDARLAHCAWWGNYFRLDNMLAADIYLGAWAIRVGYHNRIFSSKVNHIISNNFSHAVVIGITTDWHSVKPKF